MARLKGSTDLLEDRLTRALGVHLPGEPGFPDEKK
jgi:hypothetical protein